MCAYCGTELVSYMSQVAYTQLRGLLSAGTLDNYVVGTLIPHAEKIIDGYVGRRDGTLRHFNPSGGTASPIYFDGNGKSVLWIPPKYAPFIRDSAGHGGVVTVDGSAIGTANIHFHDQYMEYYGGNFSEGAMNIQFSGSYGYATVPKDVEYVCGALCANALLDLARRYTANDVMRLGAGDPGFESMLAPTAIFSSPTVFTEDLRRRLDVYRVKWVDMG